MTTLFRSGSGSNSDHSLLLLNHAKKTFISTGGSLSQAERQQVVDELLNSEIAAWDLDFSQIARLNGGGSSSGGGGPWSSFLHNLSAGGTIGASTGTASSSGTTAASSSTTAAPKTVNGFGACSKTSLKLDTIMHVRKKGQGSSWIAEQTYETYFGRELPPGAVPPELQVDKYGGAQEPDEHHSFLDDDADGGDWWSDDEGSEFETVPEDEELVMWNSAKGGGFLGRVLKPVVADPDDDGVWEEGDEEDHSCSASAAGRLDLEEGGVQDQFSLGGDWSVQGSAQDSLHGSPGGGLSEDWSVSVLSSMSQQPTRPGGDCGPQPRLRERRGGFPPGPGGKLRKAGRSAGQQGQQQRLRTGGPRALKTNSAFGKRQSRLSGPGGAAEVPKNDLIGDLPRSLTLDLWTTPTLPTTMRNFEPILELIASRHRALSKISEFWAVCSSGLGGADKNVFPVRISMPLNFALRACVNVLAFRVVVQEESVDVLSPGRTRADEGPLGSGATNYGARGVQRWVEDDSFFQVPAGYAEAARHESSKLDVAGKRKKKRSLYANMYL